MAKLALNGGPPLYSGSWPVWPEAGEPEKAALSRIIEINRWSYNGPEESEFKQKWSGFTNAKHSLLVANGTVSLQLILEALGIGYGDEVIIPGLSWQADAAVVADINAIPVMVDVEEDSWCIDPAEIEKAITSKTRAVIPVHLYGSICNIEKIVEIAENNNLFVLEDCAHQHGSRFKGRHVGTFGNAGSFSLQNSKVLTCGEGGLIITNDDELAVKLDALRNCGRKPEGMLEEAGDFTRYSDDGDLIQSGNYRITEFQAAVLSAQFMRFPEQLEKRDHNAQYLNQQLNSIDGIKPMLRREGTDLQSYFNYAFRYNKQFFKERDVQLFRKALGAELGIEFGASYEPLNNCTLYRPLTKKRHNINEKYFSLLDPSRFNLPVSKRIFEDESVTVHHSFLLNSKENCEKIVGAVLKIKENIDELK